MVGYSRCIELYLSVQGGGIVRDAKGLQDLRTDSAAYPEGHLGREVGARGQAAARGGTGAPVRGEQTHGTGGAKGVGGSQRAGELDGPKGWNLCQETGFIGCRGAHERVASAAAGRQRADARGSIRGP